MPLFQRLEPLAKGELKIDMTGETGKYGKPRMIDRTKVTMFTDLLGKKKSTVTKLYGLYKGKMYISKDAFDYRIIPLNELNK